MLRLKLLNEHWLYLEQEKDDFVAHACSRITLGLIAQNFHTCQMSFGNQPVVAISDLSDPDIEQIVNQKFCVAVETRDAWQATRSVPDDIFWGKSFKQSSFRRGLRSVRNCNKGLPVVNGEV